ncbi:VOC family protein [Murinocardiopsis flavida]|uniref:VOC family protein n=1 Tax=Murinocardiopsis flavida TaxID=645275 RepID=UPI000D0D77C3|nr:VOC family protein [Murinocardiopsis flavida]
MPKRYRRRSPPHQRQFDELDRSPTHGGLAGGEDDWAEQADRVAALGAERVSDNEQDRVRWVEFRDPEGNTFRIFAPRPL